jgi:hypothetical protein
MGASPLSFAAEYAALENANKTSEPFFLNLQRNFFYAKKYLLIAAFIRSTASCC